MSNINKISNMNINSQTATMNQKSECGREVYIPMAPAETSETDYTQTAQGTGEADETNCQGERQKGRET